MGLRLAVTAMAALAAFAADGIPRASADDLPWLHQTPSQSAPSQTTPSQTTSSQVSPVTPAQPAPGQPAPVQPVPSAPPGTVTPAPVQPATPPGASVTPVAPVAPGPAQPVHGTAQILDTANLMVDGRTVHLFGIQGEGAPYDGQMAAYLKSQGGFVNCAPHGGTDEAPHYVCMTKSGYDLAEAALYNGGARASLDATPEYKRQESLARTAQRGIWARKRRERDSSSGPI
jgi:type IV secretory pathway VirB10-like protein